MCDSTRTTVYSLRIITLDPCTCGRDTEAVTGF